MSRYRSDPELGDYQNNKPSACARFLHYTWKTITCLFSHITLVSMVVSYCVLGAFTFETLEVHHERDVKRSISKLRLNVTNHLWKLTNELEVLEITNFTTNATIYLKEFENALLKAMTKDGWDGEEDVNKVQWTSTGALFYSIIVITTIVFILPLFANILCEDNKWVWRDNNRKEAQARYEVVDDSNYPQQLFRPGSNNYLNRPLPGLPGITNLEGRPRPGIGFNGDFLNRPRPGFGSNSFLNRPNSGFGASDFLGASQQFLPQHKPGGVYANRPSINNNYAEGSGILTGPISSWVPQKPFKNFDQCKCTEKFNCPSPGISYGHCDVGKQYCCTVNSKLNQIGEEFPSRPIHDPALGVLTGPGGPNGVPPGGTGGFHGVPLVGSGGPQGVPFSQRPYRPGGFGLGPEGTLSGPIYGRSNQKVKS